MNKRPRQRAMPQLPPAGPQTLRWMYTAAVPPSLLLVIRSGSTQWRSPYSVLDTDSVWPVWQYELLLWVGYFWSEKRHEPVLRQSTPDGPVDTCLINPSKLHLCQLWRRITHPQVACARCLTVPGSHRKSPKSVHFFLFPENIPTIGILRIFV